MVRTSGLLVVCMLIVMQLASQPKDLFGLHVDNSQLQRLHELNTLLKQAINPTCTFPGPIIQLLRPIMRGECGCGDFSRVKSWAQTVHRWHTWGTMTMENVTFLSLDGVLQN